MNFRKQRIVIGDIFSTGSHRLSPSSGRTSGSQHRDTTRLFGNTEILQGFTADGVWKEIELWTPGVSANCFCVSELYGMQHSLHYFFKSDSLVWTLPPISGVERRIILKYRKWYWDFMILYIIFIHFLWMASKLHSSRHGVIFRKYHVCEHQYYIGDCIFLLHTIEK